MTDNLQNGKLVADIVKRDFQIMSRRIHAGISATIRTVFTRSIEHWVTTHVSSSDPRLEHHCSPSGTRKIKASAHSLHGAEYVECRRSSRCRSCLTNWSIIMCHHETQGLQIVLDAWTNIAACKVPYSVAWSWCISWLRQNMPLFTCGWCRNSGTLSIFWMDYVLIPVRLVTLGGMILPRSLSEHLMRPVMHGQAKSTSRLEKSLSKNNYKS